MIAQKVIDHLLFEQSLIFCFRIGAAGGKEGLFDIPGGHFGQQLGQLRLGFGGKGRGRGGRFCACRQMASTTLGSA